MTSQRVRLGRDVRVVSEHADGLELEGTARLAPGRPIDLVLAPTGAAAPPIIKEAMLCSWNLVRVGGGGPTFRGFCRWN